MNSQTRSLRAAEILLIEDEYADVHLTRLAFEESRLANHLHAVFDVKSAWGFLRRTEEHASAPRPDLILLDLGLPGISGEDFLQALKREPAFRSIPVAILTGRRGDAAQAEAFAMEADFYLQKPLDPAEFTRLVLGLRGFSYTPCVRVVAA